MGRVAHESRQTIIIWFAPTARRFTYSAAAIVWRRRRHRNCVTGRERHAENPDNAGARRRGDVRRVRRRFAQSGSVAKAVGGYSFEDAAKEAPGTKNFHSNDGILTFAIVTHTAGNGFFDPVYVGATGRRPT